MPLTLITGPANAGKAGEVLSDYIAQRARDPLLIVPRAGDVAHYQRELASRVVFGGRVLGFGRLFGEIARRVRYAATVVSALQRERLIAAAVEDSQLELLAGSSRTPGFVPALAALISELQRALVTPQRLTQAMRTWAADDPGRRRYADEVAGLYAAYGRALDHLGVVDEDLFAWRAIDALRAAPGKWGRSPLFLYGFDDFTGLERDAIETLAGRCGADVTVALAYEGGREAFAGRATTYQDLLPLADRVIQREPRDSHYAAGSRAALHHLERGLFEEGAGVADPGDAIRVIESGGERMEMELVAAEVLSLLRDGYRPDEIAIVVRSAERYADLLAEVGAAYGVPLALDAPVRLEHTALGMALLGLLRSALLDGSAADLLAYLRTPGKFEHAHVLDRFEAELRRRGARLAARAREVWEELYDDAPLEELDRLAEARSRGPRALIGETGRQAQRQFAGPHRRRAALLDAAQAVDAAALRALQGALGELAALDDPALPGAHDLVATLAGLPVTRSRTPAGSGVLVAEPLAIRARRFRAVFVCGLQEQEFPRPAAPEPFLPDDVRAGLASAAGLVLRAHDDRLAEERYLFYAVASRAQELLVLSNRSSDEEGSRAVPSFFLDDVRSLFGSALDRPSARRSIGEVVWDADQAPTAHEARRAQAAAGPRRAPRPIDSITGAALAELAALDPVSAGQLEAYADCPVKWFVEKLLRPQDLEPHAEPLARGGYAHEVLERTFIALRDETGSARVTPATLTRAHELLASAARELAREGRLSPDPAQQRVIAHAVEMQLKTFLSREAEVVGGFEPSYFELTFDDGDGGPGCLELGDGALRVRGRIDRVDVDGSLAVVRDYKTGRDDSRYSHKNWEDKRQFQVALYMLAVRRLMPELDVAGGVYQPLRGKSADVLRARGLLLSHPSVESLLDSGVVHEQDIVGAAEFEQALAAAEERALAIAGELRAGRLEPCPDTCLYNGKGCRYPGICRSVGA